MANLPCARTGLPLFDKLSKARAQNVLQAIADGHVSDPPGVCHFIFRLARINIIFHLFRCSRGTNSVEGGNPPKYNSKVRIFWCEPSLTDSVMANYRLRHNVDVNTNFLNTIIGVDH